MRQPGWTSEEGSAVAADEGEVPFLVGNARDDGPHVGRTEDGVERHPHGRRAGRRAAEDDAPEGTGGLVPATTAVAVGGAVGAEVPGRRERPDIKGPCGVTQGRQELAQHAPRPHDLPQVGTAALVGGGDARRQADLGVDAGANREPHIIGRAHGDGADLEPGDHRVSDLDLEVGRNDRRARAAGARVGLADAAAGAAVARVRLQRQLAAVGRIAVAVAEVRVAGEAADARSTGSRRVGGDGADGAAGAAVRDARAGVDADVRAAGLAGGARGVRVGRAVHAGVGGELIRRKIRRDDGVLVKEAAVGRVGVRGSVAHDVHAGRTLVEPIGLDVGARAIGKVRHIGVRPGLGGTVGGRDHVGPVHPSLLTVVRDGVARLVAHDVHHVRG